MWGYPVNLFHWFGVFLTFFLAELIYSFQSKRKWERESQKLTVILARSKNAETHTHTHTHTHASSDSAEVLADAWRRGPADRSWSLSCMIVSRSSWRVSVWSVSFDWRETCLPSWCNRKHYGRVSQRYRFESRRGQWALFSLIPSALSFVFLWHTHTHTHTHTIMLLHILLTHMNTRNNLFKISFFSAHFQARVAEISRNPCY